MNTKLLSKLAIASVTASAVLAGTNAAQAQTLIVDQEFTASFTDITTELMDEILSVPKYTGSGTLAQVMFMLDAELTSQGTLTNTASGPESFDFSTRVQEFDVSAVTPTGAPDLDPFDPFALIGEETYTDLASGATVDFLADGSAATLMGSSMAQVDTDLFDYTGAGTVDYGFNTQILTSFVGGGGNIQQEIETLASATLTVQYKILDDGQPPVPDTPEPTSILGLGLIGGLGLLAKRKKS